MYNTCADEGLQLAGRGVRPIHRTLLWRDDVRKLQRWNLYDRIREVRLSAVAWSFQLPVIQLPTYVVAFDVARPAHIYPPPVHIVRSDSSR